jgi:hypothetical protein
VRSLPGYVDVSAEVELCGTDRVIETDLQKLGARAYLVHLAIQATCISKKGIFIRSMRTGYDRDYSGAGG